MQFPFHAGKIFFVGIPQRGIEHLLFTDRFVHIFGMIDLPSSMFSDFSSTYLFRCCDLKQKFTASFRNEIYKSSPALTATVYFLSTYHKHQTLNHDLSLLII